MVKKSPFCKLLYHRKCKRGWMGRWSKKAKSVNVVCERPPFRIYFYLYCKITDIDLAECLKENPIRVRLNITLLSQFD